MAEGNKLFIIALVLVLIGGDRWVDAQVHHVVGGDRGWDPSSDLASWSSGKIFSVGDKIWFAYSAAQENIVEFRSKEEYEACDVSNPIKMYTDGLDRVSLDQEGIRYFASGKPESCKNGLKLHVEVQSHQAKHEGPHVVSVAVTSAMATPPTTPTPSAANHLINGLYCVEFVGLLLLSYLTI